MNTIKKITAILLAAIIALADVGIQTANAAMMDYPTSATWSVTYVNVPGAP